jgi:tetratricopeptide (TPR) repeat protein
MNNSIRSGMGKRLGFIIVLSGLLALSALVVQWRMISQLRRENVALWSAQQAPSLPQEQRATQSAEPTAFASPDDPERAQEEKRELLRLRNEVRQLRERVAEAKVLSERGTPHQPVAISDRNPLAQSNLNPIPRTGLTSEWQGMEQFATNKYAQALERLAKADQYIERFHALDDVAKMSFAFGQTEDARTSATELLALVEKYKGEIWSKGACGQAVHDGNIVLGRLALEQGAIEDAKRYLLEAGTSSGSPVLGSFGPNMSLARELLEKGERDTVLQYFERCGKFWQNDSLTKWTEEVNAGRIPNFGANLIH